MNWLDKSGPFWDEDREENVDDYFHFEGTDVTDQGLGEAARRVLAGRQAGAYSFFDSSQRFARSVLDLLAVLETLVIETNESG